MMQCPSWNLQVNISEMYIAASEVISFPTRIYYLYSLITSIQVLFDFVGNAKMNSIKLITKQIKLTKFNTTRPRKQHKLEYNSRKLDPEFNARSKLFSRFYCISEDFQARWKKRRSEVLYWLFCSQILNLSAAVHQVG